MKVTIGASTGANVEVWCEEGLFHARRAHDAGLPETCIALDLFEVIAELAQLDLEDARQAAEAVRLAERAQSHLGSG
ncbi:MAG: hypothetical protein JO372_09485 [Solirubrobacterales bacterium]|nr:hypothetical protein [Solirubrobacterales bacterium]